MRISDWSSDVCSSDLLTVQRSTGPALTRSSVMKLDFILQDKLSVSKTNMRYAKKAPDVSDILPTVRSRGVLQPLIVRPNCGPGAFEIVAGSRRWTANGIALAERSEEHTSELPVTNAH